MWELLTIHLHLSSFWICMAFLKKVGRGLETRLGWLQLSSCIIRMYIVKLHSESGSGALVPSHQQQSNINLVIYVPVKGMPGINMSAWPDNKEVPPTPTLQFWSFSCILVTSDVVSRHSDAISKDIWVLPYELLSSCHVYEWLWPETYNSSLYNPFPRQHLRMVLLYSDVAQVTGYIIVISLLGVVLHIGVMAMPPPREGYNYYV